MTEEELHLAAAEYATRRKDAYKEAVKKGKADPMNEHQLSCRWIDHYDGYREGYWVATGQVEHTTDSGWGLK